MNLTSVMAWTQEDVDAVKAAILKLATGERVVTVSYAGPPARSVTYHATDLASLRTLYSEMQGAVTAATGSSYRLVTTRKGL